MPVRPAKTALILSGGGMFGAWEAGAWQVLSQVLRPDWVIGASAGSLNAWVIASGADPQELVDRWLSLHMFEELRLRFPTGLTSSLLDPTPVHTGITEIFNAYKPQTNVGITLTRIPSLRVEMVTNEKITAQHLIASCAVPVLLPPVLLDGHWYWDGGLVDGLPHSFGREVGATRLVCLNVWVGLPWWWNLKGNLLHALERHRRKDQPEASPAEWIYLAPPKMPGSFRDAAVWTRSNAQRWIDEGRKAAELALHHFH